MNSMKRQNDTILKEELPRSVGAEYATGDQWRNNSRKNEGMEPSKNNTQLWMGLVRGKKHKLESRLPEEISITSDIQMTPPLWQKVKRT